MHEIQEDDCTEIAAVTGEVKVRYFELVMNSLHEASKYITEKVWVIPSKP